MSYASSAATGGTGSVNEGTVTFTLFNGSTPVGSAVTSGTVNGGAASVDYLLPGDTAAGTYTVLATYNPGSDYTGSSDNTHTLMVSRAVTAALVAVSAPGQAAVLNASL